MSSLEQGADEDMRTEGVSGMDGTHDSFPSGSRTQLRRISASELAAVTVETKARMARKTQVVCMLIGK